ncbi:MAG: HDOD domain-containing protein [Planctomycetes bacterium]|nr:HDOD domain-containing protein [Planctomycetota bacterium]
MASTDPTTAPTAATPEVWLLSALTQVVDAGAIDLPLMPEAAAQIMDLVNDPKADAKKLAVILQRDPSLASHVLRVANSTAFAPREPIVSLQQAISRLGMTNLTQIATAVAVKSKVFQVRGYEDLLRDVWFHSATAGAYAKEVARLRRHNVEGAFLCGLLHDIGKPIVLQSAVDLAAQKGVKVERAVMEAAMDALHGRVGSLLASKWKLPAFMQSVMVHHHDPANAKEHVEDTRIACLADRLSYWAKDGDPAKAEELRRLPVIAALNLYAEDWQALVGARERVLKIAEAYA